MTENSPRINTTRLTTQLTARAVNKVSNLVKGLTFVDDDLQEFALVQGNQEKILNRFFDWNDPSKTRKKIRSISSYKLKSMR